jgi:hypothetical protein
MHPADPPFVGSSVQSQEFSLATPTALPLYKDVSKLTPAAPNYRQPFNARMKETNECDARSVRCAEHLRAVQGTARAFL